MPLLFFPAIRICRSIAIKDLVAIIKLRRQKR